MLRILLAAAAIMPVMSIGSRPALAYGDAPWCTVTIEGPGIHQECEYSSIEECQSHVIAGNRGFCNQNPRYHGPAKRRSSPRHRRHREH
jgi:Protein of unknown function (DUF3551)